MGEKLRQSELQYTILMATNIITLASEVQLFISQGWEPHGSLATMVEKDMIPEYLQPMIREPKIYREEIT